MKLDVESVVNHEPQATKKFFGAAVFQKCWIKKLSFACGSYAATYFYVAFMSCNVSRETNVIAPFAALPTTADTLR